MKTATAKDLRVRTAALLEGARRGQEVVITHRGKAVAVLAPLRRPTPKALVPVGFGMWRARRELQDVERWVNESRAPRHARSSSIPTS
jgi:prevent-host-death family protein